MKMYRPMPSLNLTNPRLQRMTASGLALLLILAGCDDGTDYGRDFGRDDPVIDSGDPRGEYDPPAINAPDPIRLDEGASATLSLRAIVVDPDTPFDHLTITATPSAHVGATIAGDQLELQAAAGWSGRESVGLRAEDPMGLVGEGRIEVIVEQIIPPDPAAPRICTTHVEWDTFYGSATSVAFASEANGWSATSDMLSGPDEHGVFSADLDLPAGEWGYKFVLDGDNWQIDPQNPYRLDVDAIVNSLLYVPACDSPLLVVSETSTDFEAGMVRWVIDVFDSPDAPGIDLESLQLTVNRQAVSDADLTLLPSRITVELGGREPDRYTLRASIADVDGARSEELFAPLWLEEEPFEWRDAVMYFAFVDRFRNGDTSNDLSQPGVVEIANWMGGDWAGLTAAVEAGYFDDLGVNALWISAPNDNPDGITEGEDVGPGSVDRTAYHAYFPSQPRATENHFGTLEELRALTAAAHRRGIRVLTDFVANHVYETHPYFTDRTSDAEFNLPMEICREIDWARPLTCWFEDYLPDLNYGRRDVVERTVADGLWWIDQADLDGFRVDAVKHFDHNVGYLLRAGVDRMFESSSLHFYMVGETFVGTWGDFSADQLAEYISPGELTGQFNFPIFWEVVSMVRRDAEGRDHRFVDFSRLDSVVGASEVRFSPPALMGVFVGNHDVYRLISHANQDIDNIWGNGSKEQAFTAPPLQPSAQEPYELAAVAFALAMTLPGIPVIYYGDEVGLAGAGDPDNRRMMPSDGELTSAQLHLRQIVQILGQLRRDRIELRRGLRSTLRADAVYAYVRHLGSNVSLVVLNNSDASQSVDLQVSAWLTDSTELTEAIGGASISVSGGQINVAVPARSARIYTSP